MCVFTFRAGWLAGVGVLSDLRKFFTELRTNLDSVEEVAALSQEQGLPINPEDFLALLAQHEGT